MLYHNQMLLHELKKRFQFQLNIYKEKILLLKNINELANELAMATL